MITGMTIRAESNQVCGIIRTGVGYRHKMMYIKRQCRSAIRVGALEPGFVQNLLLYIYSDFFPHATHPKACSMKS
jgi:hypothetical protein